MFEADTGANTGRWPEPAWFEQAFAAVPDLASYLDAVSIHPYADEPNECTPAKGGIDKFWYETRFQLCRVKDVRRILDARGARGAKLWITELGWPTSGDRSVSEETQARYVHDAFRLLRRWNIVDGVVWFHYRTNETGDDSAEWFGLVHPDGKPKPAWSAFVEEARIGLAS
jgi:beta-xylosidase